MRDGDDDNSILVESIDHGVREVLKQNASRTMDMNRITSRNPFELRHGKVQLLGEGKGR